ncbi:2-dehydro-3-deoxy-6-phosphogalactonate aldolase [Zophobihabitans entericus]|uniref:2-dehydro-3-deoxy-6-phosphogalactonate aldolase n=1 Tax=Zophobihabitans entericus TaxID=1635327 RepID=A0A6G9IBX8_9GAMM|nr:2-dehydro-3-deoxy-6-phosphogalactonate aldolase [Zophobihabitans entericus]QIQ21738.1 2-dehydro-3-deoxy-6-phosphogalactonate aldolase [Zophobihabitans entericus]
MTWQTTKIPLIAILRGITPDEVEQHISLLIEAGFDAIEIPLNSPNWQESIRIAVERYGHLALIGAGTVLKAEQVEEVARLGGRLIVTPNINESVIKKALQLGLVICPGCATATEAFTAIDAGSPNLKVFPSSAFGPDYIKALTAVIPKHIGIFAVGGITPENLHDYLRAGCVGAGLGSDLYKAGQSPDATRQKAAAFIQAYQSFNKL